MSQLPKLQRRRAPEPGRPFVNRDPQLELMRNKVDQILRGDSMRLGVICFWGAFGMGKSWLLLMLESLYKRVSPQLLGTPPTFTARLDLDRTIGVSFWQDDHLARKLLIRELWKQLAEQLGHAVPDLEQASADEWADKFVTQVIEWASLPKIPLVPLIMLDTLDDLVRHDESSFFWLEEHIVEPLAMTDGVLFVFASRGELRRWKRFQVRRRVDSRRLKALNEKEAGDSVNANSQMSKAIYRYVFGHPLATDFLGTALEQRGVNLGKDQQAERLIQPSLVQNVLGQVTNELLQGVNELLATWAQCTSVLRWVNAEPLRFLADALGLERGRGEAFYIERINELQACHLLYWNSTRNCYDVDPELRRLLAHAFELDEPFKFHVAHQAAFSFHRDHLDRYPQYLAGYVSELVYHRAILGESSEPQIPTWQTWWMEFLSKGKPAHLAPWEELLKALEQDTELGQLLSPQDYERLCSDTRQRATRSQI